MIKQSFLRNYSLSKIYHQAEDEKNKLKVFYLRKVRKILKEKHENQRATQREKLSRENKEERIKSRLQHKIKTQFCDPEQEPLPQSHYGRSGTSADNRDKTRNKPDLNLVHVKFENQAQEGGSLLRNEKLKALKVKLNSSMLHLSNHRGEESFEKLGAVMRKNTVNRTLFNQRGMEMRQSGCNNHSIVFHYQQGTKQGQSECGPRKVLARLQEKLNSYT